MFGNLGILWKLEDDFHILTSLDYPHDIIILNEPVEIYHNKTLFNVNYPERFIFTNNRYETGLESIYISENPKLVVAFEGVADFEMIFNDILISLNDSNVDSNMLSILKNSEGVFSVVGYYKKGKDERIFAFSNYRQIYVDKGIITTIKIPKVGYILSTNSLIIWDLNEFLGVTKKTPEESTEIPTYRHFMLEEIHETPYILRRLHALSRDRRIEESAVLLQNAEKTYVIGNGSSLNAGFVLPYLLQDFDIVSMSSLEFMLYKLDKVSKDDLIIAITQSGNTWGVVEALKKLRASQVKIVSITNNPFGRVSKYSDIILPVLAGPELAIPATKTFVGTLGVLYLLSSSLLSDLSKEHTLLKTAETLESSISVYNNKARTIAGKFHSLSGGYIISAGLTFPIAIEGALKLKETAYSHAEAIELEEYLHGPSAALSQEMYAILILPVENLARERVLKKFDKFNIGNQVTIGNLGDFKDENVIQINADGISYLFHVTLFLQFLAYWFGVYRKTPIDAPRGLSKVVST